MADIAQSALLFVIIALSILLLILGIQVFLILREVRKTLRKTNKVLDNAGIIAESIATPVSTLSSLVMSIKTGISFANWLKKTYDLLLRHTSHKDTKEPSGPAFGKETKDSSLSSSGETQPSPRLSEERKPLARRFFRGIGKKIHIHI